MGECSEELCPLSWRLAMAAMFTFLGVSDVWSRVRLGNDGTDLLCVLSHARLSRGLIGLLVQQRRSRRGGRGVEYQQTLGAP